MDNSIEDTDGGGEQPRCASTVCIDINSSTEQYVVTDCWASCTIYGDLSHPVIWISDPITVWKWMEAAQCAGHYVNLITLP